MVWKCSVRFKDRKPIESADENFATAIEALILGDGADGVESMQVPADSYVPPVFGN